MSHVVLDDHLLRGLLADERSRGLSRVLATHAPATTNMFYLRLCRSVATARGGRLTGGWTPLQRRALGRSLSQLPSEIEIVPMRALAFAVAELATEHRLSTLGAEAIAAAMHLGAALYVWSGDDGPGIRAAAVANGVRHRAIET